LFEGAGRAAGCAQRGNEVCGVGRYSCALGG
jgi:hypothetical protein